MGPSWCLRELALLRCTTSRQETFCSSGNYKMLGVFRRFNVRSIFAAANDDPNTRAPPLMRRSVADRPRANSDLKAALAQVRKGPAQPTASGLWEPVAHLLCRRWSPSFPAALISGSDVGSVPSNRGSSLSEQPRKLSRSRAKLPREQSCYCIDDGALIPPSSSSLLVAPLNWGLLGREFSGLIVPLSFSFRGGG
jgi:hypothetical protein